MNNIETMKLSLEALELHGQQYPHMVKGYSLDAITALRQAIEQAQVATNDTSEIRVDEMSKQRHEHRSLLNRKSSNEE